jgi:AraC family transcriptional regulator, regulatory protein of adaptative response / DNA-3-methyladenine glycosylase II
VTLDPDVCYRAALARDERFDGLFFVAVRTTGIYCRPVCRARTPRRDRCVFYRTAAEAERAGFRACFRCRPELAPGSAPQDSVSRLVRSALARIEAGALNDGSLDGLADALGVSGRHLRRAMHAELGISPVDLAQTRRLALAKQLLHDTALPMVDIAFASGFGSVRRFNALFRARFGRNPMDLRKFAGSARDVDSIGLTLEYRPPYDWPAMLEFLKARAIPAVECVSEDSYFRTVQLADKRGWVRVSPLPNRTALHAEVSMSLALVLMPLVAQLRRLFDLDAQPKTIAAHLALDRRLAKSVSARPGLRVPGAFTGFEAATRAVIGQQVSVRAATTLAGRLAEAFGEPIETPRPELKRLSPAYAELARAPEQKLTALGIPKARARTLRALAEGVASGVLVLDSGAHAEFVMQELKKLPGIGEWTAQYTAMRALGWPDAFPATDLGIRKALGGVDGPRALALAEAWRPWRAYAVMHLWRNL